MNYRVVLITGASSGIGMAIAREVADRLNRRPPTTRDSQPPDSRVAGVEESPSVILTARRRDRLEELRDELIGRAGGRVGAHVVCADLSVEAGRRSVLEYLAERGLAVDLLVNNAGIGGWSRFHEQPPRRIESMIAVNATAATLLSRALLPGMVDRGRGAILNIASVAAFQPGPYTAVYYATKSYLLSLSESLSVETRGTGVHVCAYCPGPVATEFAEAGGLSEEARRRDTRSQADPRDVARGALRALASGKRVAVHGLGYRLFIFAERFLPRAVVARAVGRFQRSRLDE